MRKFNCWKYISKIEIISLVTVGTLAFAGCEAADKADDTTATPSTETTTDTTTDTTTTTSGTTTTTATATNALSATDLSEEDISTEIEAIFPAGALAVNLLPTTTYDTPCSGDDGGDPTGAARGTIQCRVSKLLADPSVYTNVGSEGFLESIQLFTKVFKRSLKNCTSPFTTANQSKVLPITENTVELACGRTPEISEVAENMIAGMSGMFDEGVTSVQLESMLGDSVISMGWGEGSAQKDMVAYMDFAEKDEGDPRERSMWSYTKNKTDGKITLNGAMYMGGNANRRYLKGDPTTHWFEFNYRWKNSNLSFVNFRGTGYSEGEGKYFLIEAVGSSYLTNATTSTSLDGTTVLRFCFNSQTKAATDVTNCADHRTTLEAATHLAFYTNDDLASAETDLPVPQY